MTEVRIQIYENPVYALKSRSLEYASGRCSIATWRIRPYTEDRGEKTKDRIITPDFQ
jgi:hypothetical protein